MRKASRPAAPATSATLQLLRAIAALGPRLHEPGASTNPDTLYVLVCETLRGLGLFALIAQLDAAGTLRVVATSLEGPLLAALEALLGVPAVGYPVTRVGPVAAALENVEAVSEDDTAAVLQPILSHLDDVQRAELARLAAIERSLLAPILGPGGATGILAVWGPRDRLAREDAPAVAALAAQLGIALENARLLRAAEEERARWRATVESMAELVVVSDVAGHLTFFNASAERILGPADPTLAPEQFATVYHLYHTDGHPYAADDLPLQRALRTGGPSPATLVLLRDVEGAKCHIVWSGAPMRDAEGTLLGAVAVGRDVTQAHLLEEQNHAALETLLRVAALVTEPAVRLEVGPLLARIAEVLHGLAAVDFSHVMLVDAHGKLKPLRLFGVSPELEAEWRAGVLAFDPAASERLTELLMRFRAGKLLAQRFDAERPIISLATVRSLHVRAAITAPVLLDGTVLGLLTIGRVHPPEPGADAFFAPWDEELLAGVARLTGEALARAQLADRLTTVEAARRAAEEANRRHEEFLSIAAHELRTPLTSIKANVQVAVQRLTPKTLADPRERQTHELLVRADRQISRLARLVGDLVDTARLQTDRLELHRERTDLRAIVREAVEEQRQITHPDRLLLDLPDRAVPVEVDADRIGQVVTNYLTNALKYSPEALPVDVRLEVVEAASRADAAPGHPRLARLTVRDRGPGLPAGEQERIWERFHRVPGVEVQVGSGVGLGLGLYISRALIERHGGAVGVASAPGEGSTFTFTLPLADDADLP